MKVELKARAKFWFNLTPAQFQALKFLSGIHYDFKCRRASEIGGFIYGWEMYLSDTPDAMLSANWGKIDTCIKICEGMSSHFPGYPHMKEIDTAFREMLRKARELIEPIEFHFETPAAK